MPITGSKQIHFLTIKPVSDFIGILKEPGIIPLYLSRMGYTSHFASFIDEKIINEKDELKTFRDSVHVISLKDDRSNPKKLPIASKSILRYIWKEGYKADVLNLYFLKHSILYAILYKLLNPHGFLYVKLDLDYTHSFRLEKQWYEPIRRWLFSLYLRHIPDLVSAETRAAVEYVRQRYMPATDKLILIPDGIDDELVNQMVGGGIRPFTEKRNRFMVVGRIGTYHKNTEMMLEAAKLINDWKDWQLHIVGPIEKAFEGKMKQFYAENPSLKQKVQFFGPIYDRTKLLPMYDEAKVFCMSSRGESFGLVYGEAQYYGEYIVSTPVSSIDDFIENDDDLGRLVYTPQEMAQTMQEIIDGTKEIESTFEKRVKHGERFRWSTICKYLDEEIRKRYNHKKEHIVK